MRSFVCLVVGMLGIALGGCSRSKPPVPVSYCSSFVTDTSVCLTEVPLPVDMGYIVDMKLLKDRLLLRSGSLGTEFKYGVFHFPSMSLEACIKEGECPAPDFFYGKNGLLSYHADSLYKVDWTIGGLSMESISPIPRLPSMCVLCQQDDYTFLFNKPIEEGELHEVYRYNIQTGTITSFGSFPEDASRFKTLKRYQEAYRHNLSVKPDGSRLLLYYLSLRRIRIYSRDGELQKDVSIDYEPFEYTVHASYNRYFYIGGVWTTDDRIYLLCTDRDMNGPCPSGCSLVTLDWEGHLLTRYRMDRYVLTFFIDEKENMFYGASSSDSRKIFKFALGT